MESIQKITQREWDRIGELMNRMTGIDLHSYREDFLCRCVFNRMLRAKIASLEEYLRRLENDETEAGSLRKAISVYHSQFNRDPMKYHVVRDVLLRETLSRKRERGEAAGERYSLRIWSAGCAGGEEPYTIAMLVSELLGAEGAQWDMRIHATDINPELVAKGRKGIYGEREIAKSGLPGGYRDAYFETLDDGRLLVNETLRRMVAFSVSDLPRERMVQGTDIIFCRNVLIYFERETVRRIVSDFHRSLNAGGYLVLGNSEVLEDSFLTRYAKLKSSGEYYYRKIREGSLEHAEALKRWRDVQAGLGVKL